MWGAVIAAILAALAAAVAAIKLWWAKFRLLTARQLLLLSLAAGVLVTSGLVMGWMKFGRSARSTDRPREAPITGRKIPNQPRVLVLAFDGLDPQLVDQYIEQGRLPNFARLAQSGVYHPLPTSMAPQSPVAWSSFITGTDPGGHGVYDFIRRDPATYQLDLALADRRKLALPWRGEPFWNRPAVARLGMTAQRLPMVFPPPKLHGRLLAGMGVWDVRGTEGTYFVFSTTPQKRPGARGMFFEFAREGSTLRGDLPGPYRAGQVDTVRVPFALELGDAQSRLRIGGEQIDLANGRWSDWISLEYRMGPLGLEKVPAITRVLLDQKDDNVTLYVSPPQFDPRRPLYPLSYPAAYSAELADALGLYATRGMPFDTQAVSDGVLSDEHFLQQAEDLTAESQRMLELELKRFERGVLFAYFEGPDIVQHLFWRTIDREHPLYDTPESARHRDVIPQLYQHMDAILGDAQARLGAGGQVVAISDHGFAPFRRAVHLNSILRDLGLLAVRQDRAQAELLAAMDWQHTQAYAAGFNCVYLNLAGRERDGIVPAGDYEALTRRIALALEAWKDPDTREQPFHRVYLGRQLYAGGDLKTMPDLVVGYARGYRASWETALGAVPAKTVEANAKKWSGDHTIDAALVPGVFFSSDRQLDATSLREVGAAIDGYLEKRTATLP